MSLNELPDSTLLLFDGLDELISHEQLDRLSGDLFMLQHSGKFGLIVSSKLPWDQMPRIDTFYQWSNAWEVFLPCFIQNLSVQQIKSAVWDDIDDTYISRLNTPFLLGLYLQTTSLPDDPWTKKLISRWGAERLFNDRTLTEELLFYRSLIVQIIRWYESNQGQKIQWEIDTFLLLHTMPAIAYQMYRSEMNDSTFDPASVVFVDESFIRLMINTTYQASKHALRIFPGYKNETSKYRRILQQISFETFLSGAVPSLFRGNWDGINQFENPRFNNYSLRDNLAFLHIANVFLLAYEGELESTIEALQAYGHTVELIPAKQLQKVESFFELITEKELKLILKNGPNNDIQSPLSRFLMGHIGATFCEHVPRFRSDKSISSDQWYEAMTKAFCDLEKETDPKFQQLVEQRLGLAYIYGQTIYARNLRGKGQYILAEECAENVIAFQKEHPAIINSDGYHIKALVLLEQISLLMNGRSCEEFKQISMDELVSADQLLYEMKQLISNTKINSGTLKHLSEAQYKLLPIFIMILERSKHRWNSYAKYDFFENIKLRYLCSASYVAKYYCILAAISPGHSGMAYNLLGSIIANDTEVLENDAHLPFFKANPNIHLEIDNLAYEHRVLASFQIYLVIYNIRRGPQPYSARRLCEFLLKRQVCLDRDGQPMIAIGTELFSSYEFDFLEQATSRALMNKNNSEMYWRARYLHELYLQKSNDPQNKQKQEQAKRAIEEVWKKISGDQKLQDLLSNNFTHVDFLSVLVIIESLSLSRSLIKAPDYEIYTRLIQYLKYSKDRILLTPKFTTGTNLQMSDIHDCLRRIQRFTPANSFMIDHLMIIYNFKL